MKTVHRLLALYSTMIVLFVMLFSFVIYASQPSPKEVMSMILSIVMFALIPFGIIFLIWKHHKH
jgi:hypothetical protein